jgi:hypothetical protein
VRVGLVELLKLVVVLKDRSERALAARPRLQNHRVGPQAGIEARLVALALSAPLVQQLPFESEVHRAPLGRQCPPGLATPLRLDPRCRNRLVRRLWRSGSGAASRLGTFGLRQKVQGHPRQRGALELVADKRACRRHGAL